MDDSLLLDLPGELRERVRRRLPMQDRMALRQACWQMCEEEWLTRVSSHLFPRRRWPKTTLTFDQECFVQMLQEFCFPLALTQDYCIVSAPISEDDEWYLSQLYSGPRPSRYTFFGSICWNHPRYEGAVSLHMIRVEQPRPVGQWQLQDQHGNTYNEGVLSQLVLHHPDLFEGLLVVPSPPPVNTRE